MSNPKSVWAVGDGWLPIVEAAVEQLEDLGADILQVKQKFGGLRIYFVAPIQRADEASAIVAAAERICADTCERCGSVDRVELVESGWYETLCAPCKKARLFEGGEPGGDKN